MDRRHRFRRNVRVNGQRDLRTNLEDAIAASGRSRAAICREASVDYQRLSNGIRGLSWIWDDEVEALAAVFNMSADELAGDSMLDEDDDRWPEFDYDPHTGKPPSQQTAAELAASRHARALCSACGALRYVRIPYFGHDIIDLSCRVCCRVTTYDIEMAASARPVTEAHYV